MYAADHARPHPDQPLLIMGSTGETVTYAEYEARANRLAQLFRAQGLRRGDHVAMFLENHPRYLEYYGVGVPNDELPRLPTGKLYKRLLRDRYRGGHSTRIG